MPKHGESKAKRDRKPQWIKWRGVEVNLSTGETKRIKGKPKQ